MFLSERSQPENAHPVWLKVYNILKKGKIMGTVKKINHCQGLGVAEGINRWNADLWAVKLLCVGP